MNKPAFYVLFGVLFTGGVSLALGRLLLTWLRLRFQRGEQWLFCFLLGAAAFSVSVFAISAVHLLHKGTLLGFGGAAIAAALVLRKRTPIASAAPRLPRFWKFLFLAGYLLFGVIYFFYAMAPELSPDGSAYHLGFVTQVYRARGLIAFPYDFYKNMPMGLEMLFIPAYAIGRHSAAAMVHFLFLLVLPLLMVSFGRRFGLMPAGVIGALLVYAAPVAGIDGFSAYVDVGLAAVLFGVFYLVQIWDQDRDARLLIAVGILAGFAAAIKYTGAIGLVYAVVFVGWRRWRSGYSVGRPLAVISGTALVSILPWIIKSLVFTGSPLPPFLNAIFHSPLVHGSSIDRWMADMRRYDIPNLFTLPLEVTLWGGSAQGFVGPVFLLAPFGLFALRWREGRKILFCALLFLLPYFGNIGTRFLLPVLPLLALAMGMAFASTGAFVGWAVVLAHLFLCWPQVSELYCTQGCWRPLPRIPTAAAFRRVPESKWLGEKLPGYLTGQMLDARVPAGARVLSTYQPAEAYTARELDIVYQSARGEVLRDAMHTAVVRDYYPSQIEDFHFSPRPLRKLRVVRTVEAESGMWSIAELRIFLRGAEIPRGAASRLRADPNPQDVQLAFDNNLATRWRSWELPKPGMFVEVDFGSSVLADMVRVECAPEEGGGIRLEGMDDSGKWQTLGGSPEISRRAITRSLRKGATAAMKAAGYRYLLVDDASYMGPDIRRNTELWGLKEIGAAGDGRLYWIE